ncbi:hypothetical protein ACFLZV_02025 [Candidatus Margulisiibacteriota bacterium]
MLIIKRCLCKTIIIILCLAFLLPSGPKPILAKTVKHGILKENETWDGEIRLIGDVVIPKDKSLKIKANTILLYEQSDIKNYGKDNKLPELVVYGNLELEEPKDSIRSFDLMKIDNKTKIIQVTPYQVDTKSLRDEFRSFREQYVILWSIMTIGLIYAVTTINNI